MTVEQRVTRLETRMMALEQMPVRMDRLERRIDRLESDLRAEIRGGDEETRRVLRQEMREGNVMIVTALTEQIEESRRHARVLHEEAVGRIGLFGEAFAGLNVEFTAIRGEFDAPQSENRAMFERILARIDSSETPPTRLKTCSNMARVAARAASIAPERLVWIVSTFSLRTARPSPITAMKARLRAFTVPVVSKVRPSEMPRPSGSSNCVLLPPDHACTPRAIR